MCGIVAMRSCRAPIDPDALRAATAALRHRGPDGERTWLSPDGMAGLGHTRLAIIDPAAAQPIPNEDQQLRLVVNGEFYGFEAIRRDLERAGHRFRTGSDSEIALHLYEEAGRRCLHSLRGEFAFVIWDARSHTLFAARDRFGIKPLFYAEHRGLIVLASEAKALFAAGIPAGWDLEGVFQTLHACPADDRSLFAGVRQIPPGHYLVATPDSIRIERYWDIASSRRKGQDAAVTPAEAAGQVHVLLDEAVRLRMRADGQVGCLLSGGLDSSAVLGLAAAHSDGPVPAFTIGFDEAAYDERDAARSMARHVNAEHHVLALTERDLADHFCDVVRHAEMVQYNAHGTARFLLSRAIQRTGCKSVLAGEGADELFFGYEFTRAALPRPSSSSRVRRWSRRAAGLLRSPQRTLPGLAAASPALARLATVMNVSSTLLTRVDQGVLFARTMLTEEFVRSFKGHDLYRALYARCHERAGIAWWEPARQLLYLWFRSIFVNYHLACDRLDMAHGVEVRLPFLDHVLFEYANTLPLSLFPEALPEKHVLRQAARPYISPAVYARAKQPFFAPPSATRAGTPLHEVVQDTLRGPALAAVPFFDRASVVRLLDGLPSMDPRARAGVDSLLMMAVSLCIINDGLLRHEPVPPVRVSMPA